MERDQVHRAIVMNNNLMDVLNPIDRLGDSADPSDHLLTGSPTQKRNNSMLSMRVTQIQKPGRDANADESVDLGSVEKVANEESSNDCDGHDRLNPLMTCIGLNRVGIDSLS